MSVCRACSFLGSSSLQFQFNSSSKRIQVAAKGFTVSCSSSELNMLWRCSKSLLSKTRRSKIWKTASFRSIHQVCEATGTQELGNSNGQGEDIPNKRKPIILTHSLVYSTLLNCPSDMIALSFFLWCAKQRDYFHNAPSFDLMINVVARLTERYKTVRGIVNGLESFGCVTKGQTFLLLLRICWRGGMYEMVFDVYEEMGRLGFVPNTFAKNVIMDVLFRVGRADVAIKALKETQLPNFLSFNIALCNLSRLNDIAKVKDVIRIMLRKGFYPNIETFEMVLNCFCKKGRISQAYQVLGLIISLGIPLSVNAWTVLIDGFCRLHRVDVAGNLLGKMIDAGCSPNVVTYTSLVKGFMECNMVCSAYNILNTMECKGHAPDLVFYNVLIDCLSKIGKYDEALDVFDDLLEQNLVPDSYTFSSLISTVCLSGRFSLLTNIAHGIAVEADLVVCNSLLNYFCKAGFPTHAVELYAYMLDRGLRPDKYTFVGLLCGLCGARRIDDAVKVYQGIVMNTTALDAHVHTVVIDRLIKAGKCHRAIRFFRRAIRKKYSLDVVSYTVAIFGLLKGGRIGEASTLYHQMKEAGLSPNSHLYNVMLTSFCKERDIEMVKQLLQEIIEARVALEYRTVIRVTSFIFKFHPSSSAIDQLSEMWNLGLIPDDAIYTTLCDGLGPCVKVGGQEYFLFQGQLEVNQSLNSSSSDDSSDVAASMG